MQPDDTVPDAVVRIPLRARDGSIRAYVVVDATDADWVNQWPWILHIDGYAARSEWNQGDKCTILLHRELLGLTRGDGMEGDHRDRDRLNCRRRNLRAIPKKGRGQQQNVSKHQGCSSRYRGVSWLKERNKWEAYVTISGKKRRLGRFVSETEAADVARSARAGLMPFATD